MFLVFEGIDGSGKSTQARLLAERLREGRGADGVLLVREPGGTELGERVRALILESREDLSAATELFLFMAARAHLARRVIAPALARGTTVISDRFVWSSVAYQGYAGGIEPEQVLAMGRVATGGLEPDLTFVLDLDPGAADGRVVDRNRMEEKGLEYQERVRAGFLALAASAGDRAAVIDGRGTPEEVHDRIVAALERAVGAS